MRTAATRPRAVSTSYVAFELGDTEWTLAMTPSLERPPRLRTSPARDLARLESELTAARAHFGLAPDCATAGCYEAGRDGFWLHRFLASRGITNSVVDASSIEVNRRRRRTKTDRLDAVKLVTMLMRAAAGERKVWSVVTVPPYLVARLTRDGAAIDALTVRIQALQAERRVLLRTSEDPAIARVRQLHQLRG